MQKFIVKYFVARGESGGNPIKEIKSCIRDVRAN